MQPKNVSSREMQRGKTKQIKFKIMKKLLQLVAVLLLVSSLTSCEVSRAGGFKFSRVFNAGGGGCGVWYKSKNFRRR